MTLVKTTERIVKDYSTNTNGVENIESASFTIKDGDTVIGNATATDGNLNLNIYGLSSKKVADLETVLTSMIGLL